MYVERNDKYEVWSGGGVPGRGDENMRPEGLQIWIVEECWEYWKYANIGDMRILMVCRY